MGVVESVVDEIEKAIGEHNQRELLEKIVGQMFLDRADDAHGACKKVWVRQCDANSSEDLQSDYYEGFESACNICADAARTRVLRDAPDWPETPERNDPS